jgi:peptidoglycan hydrolase-like protein with peptidoglycan-binding domain
VLGETTDTCEQLLYSYIHPNRQNDVSEVIKLQTFLRDLEGHFDLEVNGVYDAATQQAVYEFQQKYSDRVLTPWGLPLPTRFVYYTTRKMVNEIYCEFAQEFPLTTDQQSEIAWYRNQGITYRQSSSSGQSTSDPFSSGKEIVEGVTSTVEEVVGMGQKAATTVKEQTASAVSAGTSFFGSVWNWFKGIFSR